MDKRGHQFLLTNSSMIVALLRCVGFAGRMTLMCSIVLMSEIFSEELANLYLRFDFHFHIG
jgi:hypothetical protein